LPYLLLLKAFMKRRQVLKSSSAAAAVSVFGVPMHVLAQAARGGTVVMGTTQRPRHLNPAVQSGAATMMPGGQIFATPMRIDNKWQPQPYLAESWVVSDDARSITLRLRKDAKFHDGKPITAADVQFSIETVRDNHPFKSMFAPVNAVTIPDPYTAVIRLSEPHPALAIAMTTVFLPILPKHIYGDGQPVATHPRNSTNIVGSGPFKVTDFKPGEHIILERFDGFFIKDKPLVDRIIVREFKDPSSLLLAFERGEIDINLILTDPKDAERARKVPGATVIDNAGFGIGPMVWLAFNCKHPKLEDKRVRQAINFAIDKDYLTKTLFGGFHGRAFGPMTDKSPFFNPTLERYDLNLQKAAQLLDAAGLKPGANGIRLSLVLDNLPGDAGMRTAMEYVKSAVAKVGIDVSLRSSPDFPTWARRVSSFDFEMTIDSVWNWGDPVIGVHRTYLTSNIRQGVIWSNTQQYSNPKVDDLLALAGKERDIAKRKAHYAEFQKLVVDDSPIAYLYQINLPMGIRRATGVTSSVWGVSSPMLDLAVAK
jgi:peptide/nickel transport system substrate-binding protein